MDALSTRLQQLADFGLNGAQLALRREVHEFAEKEIRPFAQDYERRGEFPLPLVRKLAERGYLGVVTPKEYGGQGLDHVSYCIVAEEIARADYFVAELLSVHASLVSSGILKHGTEAQKRRYLPRLARGELLAAAGFTEPGCGSDLASLTTTARRDGNRYLLNGAKTFISHAPFAGLFLVLATLDRSRRHKGICAFLLERDAPGFDMTPVELHGMRRSAPATLRFSDTPVPAENLLGAEGGGFAIVGGNLDVGRLAVAARAVGQSAACIEACLDYARRREAFGQPIGRFQMIQQMIADMLTTNEAARALVYRVAAMKDAGRIERLSFETSMAKLYASEVAMKIITDAVQVHGGAGLSTRFEVGRFLQEGKLLQIGEGTSQVHRMLIAEQALGYRKL